MEVHVTKLKEEMLEYKNLYHCLEKVNEIVETVSSQMENLAYVNVKKTLFQAKDRNEKCIIDLKSMEKTLGSILREYEKAEQRILSCNLGFPTKTYQSEEKELIDKYFTSQVSGNLLVAEGDISTGKMSIMAEGMMSVTEGQGFVQGKLGEIFGVASFLKAEGEITCGIPDIYTLYDFIDFILPNSEKEKTSEEIEMIGISGFASASVLSAEISTRIGTESLNYHRIKKGSLLGATANGGMGVIVNKENIGVKAGIDAEAYLAKGEIIGGFTIFGIDIEIAAEGMIGVQAEAGFEVDKDGFSVEGGLGPLGVDVTIDWSDFGIGRTNHKI